MGLGIILNTLHIFYPHDNPLRCMFLLVQFSQEGNQVPKRLSNVSTKAQQACVLTFPRKDWSLAGSCEMTSGFCMAEALGQAVSV